MRLQDRIVPSIERQLYFDSAIVLQLGRSTAGDFISFVKSAPSEKNDCLAVFELHGGLDHPECKLAPAIPSDLDIGRLNKIEVIAVPNIRFENPPAADDLALHRCRDAAASTRCGTSARRHRYRAPIARMNR